MPLVNWQSLLNRLQAFPCVDRRSEIAKAIIKANKVAIAKPELAPYGRAAVFSIYKQKVVGSS